jgi:surface carbohydrate biosynthesis protein
MNPRVIITHIDNNPLFYELVSEFPNVLSFLIQNGIRDDFLRNNNNYRENSVTYTLVHNRNIGQYYSSKLTTKIILVGSIRNNSVPIDINRSKTKLVYISTFVDQGSSEDGQINLPSGNVTYSDFLAIEKSVFTRVLNWSSVNSLDLVVAGAMRNKASAQRERNFFLTLAGSRQIEYSPRTDLESTYKLIDTSAMVVSIDSTIGYEALARGHKVALLSVRANILGHDDRLIGFPNLIDNKLPFATQDSNLGDCDSVLDYVWSCNLETWKKIVQDASPELMVYDPGNLILKKLLE